MHVFFFSRTLSIFHNTCLSSWWRQMVKLRNQKCRLLKKHHTLHININLMQRIFNALLKFLFLGTIYTVFKWKNCYLYQIGLFWFHLHKEANCIQFLISTISLCMIQISGEIVFFYIDSPDTIKCRQICTFFSCSTAIDCCWWVLMTINP